MITKPIRNKKDHEDVLNRINMLMGAEFGTPEGEELNALVDLIEDYEENQLFRTCTKCGAQLEMIPLDKVPCICFNCYLDERTRQRHEV